MSFRIRTASPELQRELEKKLATLQGQLGNDFEYEIEAEVLPQEQAMARAEELAAHTGAESIFVAAGVFQSQESSAQPVAAPVENETKHESETQGPIECALTSIPETQPPKYDFQKFKSNVAEKSVRAKEFSVIAASKTRVFLKNAGSFSAQVLGRAAEWSAARGNQAREQAAEWNARRLERRAAESRARAERQRAAHRQAELAAAAARATGQQPARETAPRTLRVKQQQPPVAVAKKPAAPERDSWPIWRNAFAAAACLAAIGIFLIAGGKQTKASPSVTSEVEKPAAIVPSPIAPAPAIKPAAKPVAARPKAAAPSVRRHTARAASDNEDVQEVTVRHYGTNLPSAPAKKDAKGVVQISDME